MSDGAWTLEELGERVKRALEVDPVPAPNGRVRPVPDPRTIRYYTTLGLLDRPAFLRGRVAHYGERHLLQLVAIKRLQADGLTLDQVQARLAALPDPKLRELAKLPALDDAPPVAAPAAPPARDGFWRDVPEPAASHPQPEHAPPTLVGVPLAEGATLLLPSTRPLTPEDVQALRRAAVALLDELESRGLLASPEGELP
jgi:DNA-binding transcriptional MerR regulator